MVSYEIISAERRYLVKQVLHRIAALMFVCLMLFACSKSGAGTRESEQSGVWSLGDRYQPIYSSLTYFVTYTAKGEPFCLKMSRNKKETGMSKRVKDSRTVDGLVYALCESKQQNAEGKAAYTYYECFTGSFRYFIGRETEGFFIEDYLSMDDAVKLIAKPTAPRGSVKLAEEEWNAQYKTDTCILEVLIRPNDKGALCKALPSSYQTITENGETYYTSSSGDDIVYTDGTHSVQIRQANNADTNAENYHTLPECKAILALLGSD